MTISSSYMLERGSIWLIIHLNAEANITVVEDHDHYAGGHISPELNENNEQLFIQRALNRGFVQSEIDYFLKNSKERTLKLNNKI